MGGGSHGERVASPTALPQVVRTGHRTLNWKGTLYVEGHVWSSRARFGVGRLLTTGGLSLLVARGGYILL